MTNSTQFMHYRAWQDDGISPLGGATVAIQPIPNSERVLISAAYCSFDENFNKKIGRDVAAGRIKSHIDGRKSKHVVEIDIETDADLKAAVHQTVYSTMSALGLVAA